MIRRGSGAVTDFIIRTPDIEAVIEALERAEIFAELHELPAGARTPKPTRHAERERRLLGAS